MEQVNRAYNKVRRELAEVGLLYDGVYLDKVKLVVTSHKSKGERGFVFEDLGWYKELGYEKGVIYLPKDTPHKPGKVGYTLCDTIRHEYAHAWYCLDTAFFEQDWFIQCFGGSYSDDKDNVYRQWRKELKHNPLYLQAKAKCRTKKQKLKVFYAFLLNEFATDYAATNPSEDFAETFMLYLRYRNSLGRFFKKPGVQRKMLGVHYAIESAARRLLELGAIQKYAKRKV
jgi:hypothetical protein